MLFQRPSGSCYLHLCNSVTAKPWVLRLHLPLPAMVLPLIKELLTFSFYLPWLLPTSSIDFCSSSFTFNYSFFSLDSATEIAPLLYIFFFPSMYCKSYPTNKFSSHLTHYIEQILSTFFFPDQLKIINLIKKENC
ncbi:hypothetical protein J1N35_035304 [Gossypium stocksii]|uniref:Uncharacterized protein n=1 Tax=Gossypium stocksii TaxID=47602 RepID=A0A9D3UUI4_9ROSI|nr:hypothetical protein J1N35_035304 [Gossypium stocksii]